MAPGSPQPLKQKDPLELNMSMNSVGEEDGMPIDAIREEEADSAIASFMENNSGISMDPAARGIVYPVVIPQRRPGNKQRGFMKAYAPILSQCGINQEHFHEFIHTLNKAIQVSKWIAAVQVAAFGASFVPNQISMGATAAVQIVSVVAAKAQIRWKVNTFLDQANRELFCPRGLYCLIVTYNPLPQKQQEDINTTIEVPSSSRESTVPRRKWPQKFAKNLRNPFSTSTEGEQNLPSEVAPLIFSEEDEGACMKKKDKPWNKAAESNHDTLSTAPESRFENRFLDPNHPATNGGLLGLVSGGHLTRDPKKTMEDTKSILQQQEAFLQEQQSCQLELLHSQFQAMGYSDLQARETIALYEQQFQLQREQLQTQIQGAGMMPRKILKDVLYLMVVNLPTEEELAAAKMAMASAEKHDGNRRNVVTLVNVQ
ncbi:hypothetical protein N7510_011647 [Penicillium lagena]|uniref:uncharacterized protein n=1 Tax=Penicillium lagena TaxID=94218 RepID=UPI002540ED5B|nr:uncharacterized protein N7510_011647 [Penicillium lagena]KAJ5602113.1 hypothetical protein N7510_011647 [Penicillium lagena]